MHYLGDISHDIKNLMTPAQTGAQTLEAIIAGTFDDLDGLLIEKGEPAETLAARLTAAPK